MENTTVVDGRSGIIEATGKLVIKNFVEVMGGFKPGMFIRPIPAGRHSTSYHSLSQW